MADEMDAATDLVGGGRIIAFQTDYAHMTGSVTAGLLLSQFWFWTNNSKTVSRDGWFYKVHEDIHEETGMGRSEIEGARKRLRDLGILLEERRDIPARLYYKINKTRLNVLLREYATNKMAENLQTGSGKTSRQAKAKPASKPAENHESTTEKTPKTTQRTHKTTAPPQPIATPEPDTSKDVVVLPDSVSVSDASMQTAANNPTSAKALSDVPIPTLAPAVSSSTQDALIERLLSAGITPRYVAVGIVNEYAESDIVAVLESDDLKKARRPGGFIRTALKNQYDVRKIQAGKHIQESADRAENRVQSQQQRKPESRPEPSPDLTPMYDGLAGAKRKLRGKKTE